MMKKPVQSQHRAGRCALRDGFVTISISVARFIEKRSKTPVGASTIGSFRLEYEYGIEYFPKNANSFPAAQISLTVITVKKP